MPPKDVSLASLQALGGLTLEPRPQTGVNDPVSRAMQELATRRRKVALLLYLGHRPNRFPGNCWRRCLGVKSRPIARDTI